MISVNLISNPNFEAKRWNENGDTVEINTMPWNIINTGGDGWKLEKTPMGKFRNAGKIVGQGGPTGAKGHLLP